jgi:hypothetical protein
MGYRTWAQARNPAQVTLFDKVFIWNLMKLVGREGEGEGLEWVGSAWALYENMRKCGN